MTNAAAKSTSVIDAEIAVNVQSGARPKTNTDRNPSTIALSGFRTNSSRYRGDTSESG
jgi:hypothetical protein